MRIRYASERTYRIRRFLPIFVLIAVFLIPALLSLRDIQLGQPADDAIYIDLANSIGQGHGLRHIALLQAPLETWFPMGWPLILSIVLKLSPRNFKATRYLNLFFVLL